MRLARAGVVHGDVSGMLVKRTLLLSLNTTFRLYNVRYLQQIGNCVELCSGMESRSCSNCTSLDGKRYLSDTTCSLSISNLTFFAMHRATWPRRMVHDTRPPGLRSICDVCCTALQHVHVHVQRQGNKQACSDADNHCQAAVVQCTATAHCQLLPGNCPGWLGAPRTCAKWQNGPCAHHRCMQSCSLNAD